MSVICHAVGLHRTSNDLSAVGQHWNTALGSNVDKHSAELVCAAGDLCGMKPDDPPGVTT